MPFLKQQIEIVNSELLAGGLKDARFQSGRYEAIAVDISRVNAQERIETFPAIMNGNYEAQMVTPDDTYPITIYHKIVNKSYGWEKSSVGDGNKNMIERIDVKMVVFAKYAALKLSAEELEALIAVGFPDSIAKAKISPYKIDSMTVSLTGSVLNSALVFQEEYKGFELFLSAEDILFSMRYQIESKFRKGCFNICDCESGNT